MLTSVPFAPGPSILLFHPSLSSTLLLASASGAFTLADTQGFTGGWVRCWGGCSGDSSATWMRALHMPCRR